MEFALTAGAVGDFISIAALIKDIIVALDDSRGSAKEYRELVQQLNTLGQTLDAVRQTFSNPGLTYFLEGTSAIVLETVAQTNSCLAGFLGQISKYEPTLGNSASVKKVSLSGMWRKAQWKLNEKDIDKFRTEVMGYTMALKVVLEVMTVRLLQRNHESLVREQSAAESRTATLIRQSEVQLESFLDFIGRSIISRLEVLCSLGVQLRITTGRVSSMIQEMAGDLSSIRAIMTRLDRGPSDEHFILEDITGRVFPIHLKTITSWEILAFILSERFKGKKGSRRVQQKRYTLRENKTHREINGSMSWDSAFLPYQKVNMSLICIEADGNDTNGKAASSCPFCKTLPDSIVSAGVEINQNCGRFFTRVIELNPIGGSHQVSEFPAGTSHSKTTSHEQVYTRCHRSNNPSPQARPEIGPLPLSAGYNSDDEDVQGFVRVHLILKKARATESLTGEDTSYHMINFKSDLKSLWHLDTTDRSRTLFRLPAYPLQPIERWIS
ncbi:hypothetical protein FSHL1_012374 [Fusarium sambucinum]